MTSLIETRPFFGSCAIATSMTLAVASVLIQAVNIQALIAMRLLAVCFSGATIGGFIAAKAPLSSLKSPIPYLTLALIALPWTYGALFALSLWVSMSSEARDIVASCFESSDEPLATTPAIVSNVELQQCEVQLKQLDEALKASGNYKKIMLHGPIGSGKTTFRQKVLTDFCTSEEKDRAVHLVELEVGQFKCTYIEKNLLEIGKALEAASEQSPKKVILFIPMPELLNPESKYVSRNVLETVLTGLNVQMQAILDRNKYAELVVMSQTDDLTAVEPRMQDLFKDKILFTLPARKRREEFLRYFANQAGASIVGADEGICNCVANTVDVPIGHLKDLAFIAAKSDDEFGEALLSALKETPLPAHRHQALVKEQAHEDLPNVGIEDLVGPLKQDVKKLLDRLRGENPPGGVLLHGPSGTGKTRTAQVIANELENAIFISVDSTRLRSSFHGKSGQNIKNVFTNAKESLQQRNAHLKRDWEEAGSQGTCPKAIAVLWWDEIDSLGSREKEINSGNKSINWATREEVPTLLTELDGFEASRDIVFIAASNHKEQIDIALKRRLKVQIETHLPDKDQCRAMYEYKLQGIDHDLSIEEIEKLTGATEGICHATIADFVDNAIAEAEYEGKGVKLSYTHFKQAAKVTQGIKCW